MNCSMPGARWRASYATSARGRSSSRWRRRSRDAIETQTVLVAEAGTGTGKTFAYLVPALLSGGKVDHLDRHQDAAGPAVRPRHSDGARGARGAGHRGAAQGPRELRLPLPPRARAGRTAGSPTREDVRHLAAIERFARITTTGDKADCADVPENARDLVARDLHARELPRLRVPALRRVLRDGGARRGARGGRGGRQPSPVLRRPGAARRGRRRAAARLQHGDLRRGAPAAGDGEPVLRRERLDRAAPRARARRAARSCGAAPRTTRRCPRRRRRSTRRRATCAWRSRRRAGRLPLRARSTRSDDFDAGARRGARCGSTRWLRDAARRRRSAAKASSDCWQRALELAERIERWRSGADAEPRALGGGLPARAASQRDAAVDRRDLRAARSTSMPAPGSSPRRRCR